MDSYFAAAVVTKGCSVSGVPSLHVRGKHRFLLSSPAAPANGASALSTSASTAGSSSPLLGAGLSCRFLSLRVISTAAAAVNERKAIMADLNDSDDEDIATEISSMEDWIARKPRGFGLKVYDTPIEDRLLAEIEADKAAAGVARQAAAVNSSKNSRKPTVKQDEPPEGVEVFVGNLPRKRNVERDLKASMKSVEGLLHIRPILAAGQKSTREPTCKGFAFLTFTSNDCAENFIRRYDRSTANFGKTQKVITCEMSSPTSPFKKQVSPTQITKSLRLEVRETSSIPASHPSSLSSVSLIEEDVIVNSSDDEDIDLSSRETRSWNLNGLEKSNEDSDEQALSSEDDLVEAEVEIWEALENDDDLALDCELEIYGIESSDSQSSTDLILDQDYSYNTVESQTNMQVGYAEEIGNNFSEKEIKEKDNRIQQLESELKALRLQHKKKNPPESTSMVVMDPILKSREQSLESLERRVLNRGKAAVAKDTTKRKSSKRVMDSKKTARSSGSSQLKTKGLGAASRLRKRERKMFTDVLSKYTTPATETVT